MPRPVQRGDFALELSRTYGLKGKLPLVLDEVIVPVHIVGSLTDSPETSTDRMMSQVQISAADLANSSRVNLVNPLQSGVLLLVDGWSVHTATPQAILVDGFRPADVGAGFAGDPRDLRSQFPGATQFGVGALQATVGAIVAGTRVDAYFLTGTNSYEPPRTPLVILPPDSMLSWYGANVNTEIAVTAHWRERTFDQTDRV